MWIEENEGLSVHGNYDFFASFNEHKNMENNLQIIFIVYSITDTNKTRILPTIET